MIGGVYTNRHNIYTVSYIIVICMSRIIQYHSTEDNEFGDKYELFENHFNNNFSEYVSGTQFYITTNNHGWMNNSGNFEKEYSEGHEFLREIIADIGSFRLDVEFDDGYCSVTLYSHDNPLIR
jgi:hypothetical protein